MPWAVAGRLKLKFSQYRELATFAQFGSEFDASTQVFPRLGVPVAHSHPKQ